MPGLRQTFTLDDSALAQQLAALIARAGNLKPAFDDIGMDMVAVTERAFELSRSPEGVPWAPSEAAKREGRKTLVKTTNLKGSFSYIASETGVVYGTNVFYAAFHQGGYELQHHHRVAQLEAGSGFAAAFGGALVSVPARPFVGAADSDLRRWEGTLRDYLASGAEGTPA
jgi:phage gpG-like protein